MNMTVSAAKAQADRIVARLKSLGVDIKRTQGLEAAAAANNFADWNRYLAHLSREQSLPVADMEPELYRGDGKHTLLAFGPDKAKTLTLALMCAETMHHGATIPAYIDCNPGAESSLPAFIADEMLTIDAQFNGRGEILNMSSLTANPRAIHIRLRAAAGACIRDLPVQAKAFAALVAIIQLWPANMLQRIGPILIDQFHAVDNGSHDRLKDIFSAGTDDQLMQIFIERLRELEGDEIWLGRAILFITAMIRPLIYLRDHYGQKLKAHVIQQYFDFNSLEDFVYDTPKRYPDIEQAIYGLRDYVFSVLPGYDPDKRGAQGDTVRAHHRYITMQLRDILAALSIEPPDLFGMTLPILSDVADKLIISTKSVHSADLDKSKRRWEVVVDVNPDHLDKFKTPDERITVHCTDAALDSRPNPSSAIEAARMVKNALDRSIYPAEDSPRYRLFAKIMNRPSNADVFDRYASKT